MKKLFSKHRWIQILLGTLLLLAGAIVIIISIFLPSQISDWLSIILAITCFIFSASLLVSSLISTKKGTVDASLLYAALFISIGVILCVHKTIISNYIILFLGAFMCAIGGIGIVLACSWIYTKAKTINITICFIICALSLTFGIISLSFQSEVAKIIYIVVGSILVLLGIIEIYIAIKEIKKKNKRDKSKKKPAIVEAEIVEQIENNDDIKQIENNENDIKVIENKE